MTIIIWVILGGFAGWVASIIMKTNSRQGMFLDIGIGIAGAFIGGFVMSLFGEGPVTGFNVYSFLVALLGSVIFIAIVKQKKV